MSAPPTLCKHADLDALLYYLHSIQKTVAKRHTTRFPEHIGHIGRYLLEDIEYAVNEALDPGCFLRNNPEPAAKFAADKAALLARLAAEKAAAKEGA
jgi:hypothetical protein